MPRARFTDSLQPITNGTAQNRSSRYLRLSGKRASSVPGDDWKVVQGELVFVRDIDEAHLRAYCGNELYESVNQALYTDHEGGLTQHGNFIQGLRRGMLRQINQGQNIRSGKVYRWMHLSSDMQNVYTPGFKFLWPNFVSTSRSEGVWSGNTLFEIDLNGVGLTYAIDAASVSPFSSEQEVILYPYSGFEIVSVGNKNGKKHIKMRTYDTLMIDSSFRCDDMDSDDESAVGGVATYAITSQLNDLVLDIAGGHKGPGANIIAWGRHSGKNQLWHFTPDGFIVSALSGLAVSIGANGEALIEKPGEGDHQKWTFTSDGCIESLSKPGHVLDIMGGNTEAGAKLVLWAKHGGANQKWRKSRG